jgi:hypothetical protein
MNRVLPAIAFAALAVAACKGEAPRSSASQPPPGASDSQATTSEAAPPGSRASASSPLETPAAPQLALAYRLGLVLPAPQVRPLMESHQEACERAGPDQCQVLSAQAKAQGRDEASAELTMRATPAWMRLFRDRAEADAKDLGGRIQDASTEGDDLSKGIVDTGAAQQARAAERARLTELMNRRTKDLGETLQVEQEITRVQGEMDQAASELAAMKRRVAMQTVTVAYESAGLIAPEGVAAPLAEAANGFAANVLSVLAVLVTIASFLLPFAVIGAPIAWLVARRRKPTPLRPAGPPTA